MVGVPQAFTGSTNAAAIRGISGGGIPWTVGRSKVVLSVNGHLSIKVNGLVLGIGRPGQHQPRWLVPRHRQLPDQ